MRGIIKTEAGSGGKKGHRNMAHYDETEIIKARMKKARRVNDRRHIAESRDS